jgi:hypothetical protein
MKIFHIKLKGCEVFIMRKFVLLVFIIIFCYSCSSKDIIIENDISDKKIDSVINALNVKYFLNYKITVNKILAKRAFFWIDYYVKGEKRGTYFKTEIELKESKNYNFILLDQETDNNNYFLFLGFLSEHNQDITKFIHNKLFEGKDGYVISDNKLENNKINYDEEISLYLVTQFEDNWQKPFDLGSLDYFQVKNPEKELLPKYDFAYLFKLKIIR